MSSWTTILGFVLLVYAAFVIYRGRIASGDDYGRTSTWTREKNPFQFWLSVGLIVVAGLVLIFNVFHF